VFTAEPPTYEQHDKAVSGIDSIDSETRRCTRVSDSVVQVANDSRESKPYTNRNLMTTMGN